VLLLIPLLITGLRRNNDLMRALPRISQKMLTQTLRSVDERRIVARDDFGQIPPRVEYELTPLGRSLARAIASLDQRLAMHYYFAKRRCSSRPGDTRSSRAPRSAS
jgi:DNA-binding HxlR family transcriptional regulator